MSELENFAKCIDWDLLRQQKAWLLQNCDTSEQADGLVQLLDCLQDAAVLDQVADELTVFGPYID